MFCEGLHVRYKTFTGHIKFVCEDYVTLCIHTNADPMKDVCILIYKNQWNDVVQLQ